MEILPFIAIWGLSMINGNFKVIYGVNSTLAVSKGTKTLQQCGHQISTILPPQNTYYAPHIQAVPNLQWHLGLEFPSLNDVVLK